MEGGGCLEKAISSWLSQSGTKSKLLDVLNGWSADGTNIQLYPDHGHDAQKFKLKAVEGGGYQLLAKCSNDEKCVMVSAGSAPNDVFAIRANIELGTAGSDSEPRSIWYFEPADEGDVSAHHRMECSFVSVHAIPVSMYVQQMAP